MRLSSNKGSGEPAQTCRLARALADGRRWRTLVHKIAVQELLIRGFETNKIVSWACRIKGNSIFGNSVTY